MIIFSIMITGISTIIIIVHTYTHIYIYSYIHIIYQPTTLIFFQLFTVHLLDLWKNTSATSSLSIRLQEKLDEATRSLKTSTSGRDWREIEPFRINELFLVVKWYQFVAKKIWILLGTSSSLFFFKGSSSHESFSPNFLGYNNSKKLWNHPAQYI